MKYKFMQNQDPVSDDEIQCYQSFDQLLSQHKQTLWKKTLYRKLGYGAATLSILIASLVYYMHSRLQQPQAISSSTAVVQQQTPALQPPEKKTTMNTTITTDTNSSKHEPAKTPVTTQDVKQEVTTTASKKETTGKKVIDTSPKKAEGSFVAASPHGGYQQLFDYFQQSLHYPEQARQDSITGTVIIGFAINTAGKPQDLQVVKSVDPALDQEALRLVSEMPSWTPARLNGKPITTRQTVPLTFQLTSSQK